VSVRTLRVEGFQEELSAIVCPYENSNCTFFKESVCWLGQSNILLRIINAQERCESVTVDDFTCNMVKAFNFLDDVDCTIVSLGMLFYLKPVLLIVSFCVSGSKDTSDEPNEWQLHFDSQCNQFDNDYNQKILLCCGLLFLWAMCLGGTVHVQLKNDMKNTIGRERYARTSDTKHIEAKAGFFVSKLLLAFCTSLQTVWL